MKLPFTWIFRSRIKSFVRTDRLSNLVVCSASLLRVPPELEDSCVVLHFFLHNYFLARDAFSTQFHDKNWEPPKTGGSQDGHGYIYLKASIRIFRETRSEFRTFQYRELPVKQSIQLSRSCL
ncbi:hypothetical protein MPTK1_2g24020 [Marchantia polymorpha subsp. ruderalis]|uniref:Uncharacterized protein n=1 Tax=Marchantia polymorpha TaxID=3197 RepID=A0A2R6WPD3_MARPO|nr:hypothetical protein MARPO_0069s0051 [Marchantia polymorpha]BBN03506.1 hypothetical protein Mp_2g24020 [Marchantia polymorpha subsp. ruderalis]|eukprot:PTQ35712.1 hypothetical protein MARPO_0069s0051 [Marchantia polymorpha]